MKGFIIKIAICTILGGSLFGCKSSNSDYKIKNVNKVMVHYGFIKENINDLSDEIDNSLLADNSLISAKEILFTKGDQSLQIVLLQFNTSEIAISNESILFVDSVRKEKINKGMLVRGTTGGDTALILATPQNNAELMETLYKQFTVGFADFLYK